MSLRARDPPAPASSRPSQPQASRLDAVLHAGLHAALQAPKAQVAVARTDAPAGALKRIERIEVAPRRVPRRPPRRVPDEASTDGLFSEMRDVINKARDYLTTLNLSNKDMMCTVGTSDQEGNEENGHLKDIMKAAVAVAQKAVGAADIRHIRVGDLATIGPSLKLLYEASREGTNRKPNVVYVMGNRDLNHARLSMVLHAADLNSETWKNDLFRACTWMMENEYRFINGKVSAGEVMKENYAWSSVSPAANWQKAFKLLEQILNFRYENKTVPGDDIITLLAYFCLSSFVMGNPLPVRLPGARESKTTIRMLITDRPDWAKQEWSKVNAAFDTNNINSQTEKVIGAMDVIDGAWTAVFELANGHGEFDIREMKTEIEKCIHTMVTATGTKDGDISECNLNSARGLCKAYWLDVEQMYNSAFAHSLLEYEDGYLLQAVHAGLSTDPKDETGDKKNGLQERFEKAVETMQVASSRETKATEEDRRNFYDSALLLSQLAELRGRCGGEQWFAEPKAFAEVDSTPRIENNEGGVLVSGHQPAPLGNLRVIRCIDHDGHTSKIQSHGKVDTQYFRHGVNGAMLVLYSNADTILKQEASQHFAYHDFHTKVRERVFYDFKNHVAAVNGIGGDENVEYQLRGIATRGGESYRIVIFRWGGAKYCLRGIKLKKCECHLGHSYDAWPKPLPIMLNLVELKVTGDDDNGLTLALRSKEEDDADKAAKENTALKSPAATLDDAQVTETFAEWFKRPKTTRVELPEKKDTLAFVCMATPVRDRIAGLYGYICL